MASLPTWPAPDPEHPSHSLRVFPLTFGSFIQCENCHAWQGAASLTQPCPYAPTPDPAPDPTPEPAPKRDLCWSCDRELSTYLDACYSKELYLEKRCRDCRERVEKACAEFDAKFP